MVTKSIRQYFSGLPYPRCRRGRRHRLDELVLIAVLAVICGTDNWQEVAQFARAKHKWLKTFLELPHGIPSHDTFGRVFAAIDPIAFERCFLAWIGALDHGQQEPIGACHTTVLHTVLLLESQIVSGPCAGGHAS